MPPFPEKLLLKGALQKRLLYCAPLDSVNFGGPQSGPGFDDREESHIASIWPPGSSTTHVVGVGQTIVERWAALMAAKIHRI